MVSMTVVLISIGVNMLLAFIAFIFCAFVIVKYLIQIDSKLFVVLYYAFAVPLLLTDMCLMIAYCI